MEISATQKAIDLIHLLKEKHGNILLEQSSGCCEGTVPIALPADGHYISSQLVQVGTIAGVPYYIEKAQLTYLQYMHQEIDVMDGPGASFSLESGEGLGFIIHAKPLGK
jgi:uncharacterized protein